MTEIVSRTDLIGRGFPAQGVDRILHREESKGNIYFVDSKAPNAKKFIWLDRFMQKWEEIYGS